MTRLVLLRHGQSAWNLENRFTGWVDVDLTPAGVAEARRAGALLREAGGDYDVAYVSVLTRAIRTLHLALEEMDRLWLPVVKDWRLNERHYGGLTGLDKAETAARHGDAQVRIWRRSFDTPPPPLDAASPFSVARDPRYRGVDPALLPTAESLKSTLDRVTPLWESEMAPRLRRGQAMIVAAHGNSLRALVKILLRVSDADIVDVEIPTGNPLVFELAEDSVAPTSARYLDAARATPLPAVPAPAIRPA